MLADERVEESLFLLRFLGNAVTFLIGATVVARAVALLPYFW